MFEGWSPQQRKLATYGAPLVGAVVVGMKLRADSAAKAAAAAAAKPAGNAIPTIAMPSTNVVGVDQLASYENAVTGVLNHIASAVDNLTQPPTPTPAPAPAPTPVTLVPHPVTPLPILTTAPRDPEATPPPAPAAVKAVYTVQKGDSLSAIGAKFGVPYMKIYYWNHVNVGGPISNPSLLQPGWELGIPGDSVPMGAHDNNAGGWTF